MKRRTAEVLRVHGLGGLEEGIGQQRSVVDVHFWAAEVNVRTAGQVGTKGSQGDELHQLHIRDVAKAAVVRVCTANLRGHEGGDSRYDHRCHR